MLRTATSKLTRVYFENLNAIRFIAASLVIIAHIEGLKKKFSLPNYMDTDIFLIIGKLGVVLFFVLSGFLISYLLFKEKEITNTISIKDFYIRRILRIWPLYFLIIFCAFFVLPFIHLLTVPGEEKNIVWSNFPYKITLYTFFLPNLALVLFGSTQYANQTWSIGAEEQFYFVWPYLNKKFNNKWVLMFGVIFFYLFIKIFCIKLSNFMPNMYLKVFNGFWLSIPIDCMAIGGVFALVIYESGSFITSIKKILFAKWFQWTIFFITLILILKGINIPYFHYEVYSVLFGILIVNFAANPSRIFSLEFSWLNYLGKISYGMYMFHPILITISIKTLQRLDFMNNYLLYPMCFAGTIIVSSLSYELFEKRFINKKVKYSKIISGDNTKI